ncbi:hypothetical protein B0H63DRAFT_517768 [Podospora didyma]|uniref:Dihydroneopterin aldolase/epimerase domain-containing protein n=1 Tax=Podospora didyma TaxID=330526 RepID=A0AAE0P798_9PEZI|nr:hypothetical protein B0H63DRAFT_517768 [Podospora didyma]
MPAAKALSTVDLATLSADLSNACINEAAFWTSHSTTGDLSLNDIPANVFNVFDVFRNPTPNNNMAEQEQEQQERQEQQPQLSSLWAVKAAAGESFAVVRVRNLQAVVQAAVDAWGRPNRPQPALVSAEVSFSSPFDSAVEDDKLGEDTVHYGTLSKAILASLVPLTPGSHALQDAVTPATLRDVLEKVWSNLTGYQVDGQLLQNMGSKKSFLTLSRVRFASVTVTLPKATLLGEGISLTAAAVFKDSKVDEFAISFELTNLRVPTLIGINDNERLSKQFIVATLSLDKFDQKLDIYTSIESLIVKALDESSFETLEALGAHLNDLVLANYHCDIYAGPLTGGRDWQVRIRLEKPTAVPFAECPIVEMSAGSNFPRPGKPASA